MVYRLNRLAAQNKEGQLLFHEKVWYFQQLHHQFDDEQDYQLLKQFLHQLNLVQFLRQAVYID